MGTEIVQVQQNEVDRFMPVMSMQLAIDRRQVIVDAVQKLMVGPTKEEPAGIDYGVIPGTKKPTLYQPGADKLCNLFGLVPHFQTIEKVEDWTGAQHGGEPFFYYRIKCTLVRGEWVMGEGEGSCNSWESKYRYRRADRQCPKCGSETILKSKDGGWFCWKKRGGCGATFPDGDGSIEGQQTGNKPNPDICDATNTILKMAVKRAKIAATLNATSAHEFFTQDMEDTAPVTRGQTARPTAAGPDEPPPTEHDDPPPAQGATAPERQSFEPITEPQAKRMFAIARKANMTTEEIRALIRRYGFDSSKDITWDKYQDIVKEIESFEQSSTGDAA